MTRDEIRQAIFGISDGGATTIGAMCGLYASGHRGAILAGMLGAGVSGTESMAGGEFLSDDKSSIPRAAAMAAGTALGGITPAIPFVVTSSVGGLLAAVVIVLLLNGWVAEQRAVVKGRWLAYAQVYAMFAIIFVSTFLLGILLPSSP